MSVDDLLKTKRDQILSLASRYGARNVRVFGSAVRGETSPDSDIDFLIELEPGRSLLDLSALTLDLQELLGRRVDVVPDSSIYWLVRRRILKEARPL
jgi:predicted nucleotidyltransferase